MLIDIIAGARPNFMKIAPIIDAIKARAGKGGFLSYRLVHTGQHYDRSMSGSFFEQLGIPDPDINLEVGSGTQAEQTAGIMIRYEKVLLEKPSDLCMVVGDVTSTMACAIVAQKLGIPVAHVEGGIRSGDWTMPEEINRLVTDAITNWFFTTSAFANARLKESGVSEDRIFFVGNTMIDTLLRQMPSFRPAPFWSDLGLDEQNYFVLTLHRPANVDQPKALKDLLDAIAAGTHGRQVVFPAHPRTQKMLANSGAVLPDTFHCVEPMGYREFNHLVKHAFAVITDSGGITEETTVMGVPCMTLRENTERPETIEMGTNVLVGTDPARLQQYFDRLSIGNWPKGEIPPLWDGRAAERIVEHLEALFYHDNNPR